MLASLEGGDDMCCFGNINHAVPEPKPDTLMLVQLDDALELGDLHHLSVQHMQVSLRLIVRN